MVPQSGQAYRAESLPVGATFGAVQAPSRSVERWSGVHKTDRFGPHATQVPMIGDMDFRSNGISPGASVRLLKELQNGTSGFLWLLRQWQVANPWKHA